jgi:hypothetical protein
VREGPQLLVLQEAAPSQAAEAFFFRHDQISTPVPNAAAMPPQMRVSSDTPAIKPAPAAPAPTRPALAKTGKTRGAQQAAHAPTKAATGRSFFMKAPS